MQPPKEMKGPTCVHAPAEWTECVKCVENYYLGILETERTVRETLGHPFADLGRLLREAGALLDRPERTRSVEEEGARLPVQTPRAPARLFDLVEIWSDAAFWRGRGKVFSVLKDAPPVTGASPDEAMERVLIAVLNELEAQKAALEARVVLAEGELERTRAALLSAEYETEHLDASWRWACRTAQEERTARRELLATVIGHKEAEHDLPDLPAPAGRPSPATRSAGTANMLKTFRAALAEAENAKAHAKEFRSLATKLSIQKDGAYAERNELAVLVATMARALGLQAGWRQDPFAEEGWQTLVVVELPSGQVSWHLPDNEHVLVEDLPLAAKFWDGHTKAEARQRIREAIFGGFRAPADRGAQP